MSFFLSILFAFFLFLLPINSRLVSSSTSPFIASLKVVKQDIRRWGEGYTEFYRNSIILNCIFFKKLNFLHIMNNVSCLLSFFLFHQKDGEMSTKLSGTFLKISITPPPPSTRDNTYDYLFISCRRRFYLLWLSCQKLGGNNWRRDDQQSAQRSVSCCSASYFFYIGRAKALTLLCNRPLPRSVRPSHLFMVRHTCCIVTQLQIFWKSSFTPKNLSSHFASGGGCYWRTLLPWALSDGFLGLVW